MNAIFASKLYKGLSAEAKQRIKSAIADPINLELVTQLKSYLDEEYQAIAEPQPEIDIVVDDSDKTEDVVEDAPQTDSSRSNAPISVNRSASPNVGDMIDEDFGDKVEDIEDKLGDLPTDDTIEEEISESTLVDEETIIASSSLTIASSSLTNAPSEIKSMLNLDGDTQGVALVKYNDSELWVYYQDDINLNNIMYNVIEKINSSGYSYLTFNRLARSDNAIVFDISITSTDNEVQPIDSDEK